MIIGGVVGALVVGIGLVLYLLSARGGGSTNVPISNAPLPTVAGNPTSVAVQGNTGAGLPGTAVPDEGKNHVADGTAVTYNSYPPSSGNHYGTTADYGFAEQEVPEGKLVHNLEHGAVVLYYKPGLPADVVQNLRDLYTKLPPGKYGKVKLVITPYAKATSNIAIASWGRVQQFTGFDLAGLTAFYTALVDKGPEDVP